jgi:hypothetical protein
MKITTQNELAALIAGVYLGNDLGLTEERELAGAIDFGDFEALTVRVQPGENIETITHDFQCGYWAAKGVLAEAERRAAELWERWNKDDGEASNKVKLRGFNNEG